MSDIIAFGSWWLVVSVFGWLSFPLLFRWLGHLPDRGYSFAKTGGLLAVGYTAWMLGNFGFVTVSGGGALGALALVAVGSGFALRGNHGADFRHWWQRNWRTVIVVEALFVLAFAFWVYVRALNPNITFTEKPMEFAFLNSVLRSGVQPPGDPWLSGYAISYYHFGYVIMGLLIALSGVTPGVGFNLGIALLFGLVAVNAYGLGLNLLRLNQKPESDASPWISALLSPLFVLTGNLNGLMEVLHKRGLLSPQFWAWLDIKWTNEPPVPSDSWIPDRFLWWWQSSRVIHDKDLLGKAIEVIDEFPFFSFLLGDMHPHVLGLPFVFLAMAFALNTYRWAQTDEASARTEWMPLTGFALAGGALTLGGLSFLNTWDFPIYVFVAVASYTCAFAGRHGWEQQAVKNGAVLAGQLISGGALLYLPFYIGFRSQLGGILPNVIFGTQIQQFSVMFGAMLAVLLCFGLWLTFRYQNSVNVRRGVFVPLTVLVALLVISVALATAIAMSKDSEAQAAVQTLIGSDDLGGAIQTILARRLEWARVATLLLQLTIIGTAAAILLGRRPVYLEEGDGLLPADSVLPYALVLIATGGLLTLGPEFVYLRDFFGWRMNTIFKFYYQAWALWGVAAAFGAAVLLKGDGASAGAISAARQISFGVVLIAVMGASLIYPALSVRTVTENWQGTTRDSGGNPYATLDGMAYMKTTRPSDYAAINFLNDTVEGRPVIVEAVGGSYTEYGRISAHTGLPTVLGWPFHELQWRGTTEVFAGREDDVRTLYTTRSWEEALAILQKYEVRFVVVGPLEASAYGQAGLSKFENNMNLYYDAGDLKIYELNMAGQ